MNILPEVKQTIDNIKNSNYFWVDLPMNIPVKYLKQIPYTVAIGNNELFAYVLALNENQAYEKTYDYLNSIDDSDIIP
jgi:tyrosine-protein phosphatase YwqE